MTYRLPVKIQGEIFLLTVGVIETVIGISFLLFPSRIINPAYSPIWPHHEFFGLILFLTGIIFFILHSYPRIHQVLQWLAVVFLAIPIFVLVYSFLKTGAVTGVTTWTTLGLATLLTPLLRSLSATGKEVKNLSLLILVTIIIEVSLGGILLFFPQNLAVAIYGLVSSYRLPLGLAFLLGALLLGLTPSLLTSFWARTLVNLAASLPLFALSFLLVSAGALSGLVYAVLGTILSLQVLLREKYVPHELDGYPLTHKQLRLAHFEQLNEGVSWGVALILVFLGRFPRWLDINQVGLYLLVLAFCLYLIIWYHFTPPEWLSSKKVITSVSIFAIFAAIFNHFAGGIESPFFFLYFIPIVSAAYSLSPQALLIPLVVIVLALNLEWLIAIFSKGVQIFGTREAVYAAFRYAALVLIGLFTYGLTLKKQELNHEE